MIMLEPPKKSIVSCDSLLSDMNGVMQLQSPNLTGRGSVQFSSSGLSSSHLLPTPNLNLTHWCTLDSKTPLPFQFGSPEGLDYRLRIQSPRAKQVSRWKEDWEELELLVSLLLKCRLGWPLIRLTGQRGLWVGRQGQK